MEHWRAETADALRAWGLLGLRDAELLPGAELRWEPEVVVRGARLANDVELGYLCFTSRGVELNHCRIGRFCSIGPRVVIGATEHPLDRFTTSLVAFDNNGAPFVGSEQFARWHVRVPCASHPGAPTSIGHDVWIGDGAFVRRGVTVGHGAVIGARAVVTRDVAPYAIVAGAPARLVRWRFCAAVVARLLALAWWDHDLAPLRAALASRVHDIEATLELLEHAHAAGELSPLGAARHVLRRDGDGGFIGYTPGER
jgi:acetyltransferase-like isoleucine patch superfamily enzyme